MSRLLDGREAHGSEAGGNAMDQLNIGDAVEVTLATGEPRRGYIVEGPLEYLRHIWIFYQVGPKPPNPRTKTQAVFGTYAPEQIRPLI